MASDDLFGGVDGAADEPNVQRERMTLEPPFLEPPDDVLRAIASRNGLSGPITRLASHGIVNAVWTLGDAHVLRIPRDEARCLHETRVEAIVAPAVARAAVLGPKLVAYDTAKDLVPVPYTIWEKARGRTLGVVCPDPAAPIGAWSEVARQIARFHDARPAVADPDGLLTEETAADPWQELAAVSAKGALRPFQVDWVRDWLERLRPAFHAHTERVLVHDDLHQMNLLVTGEGADAQLSAILDWGDAGWGDPAIEFACFPLRAVPAGIRAYREVRPLPDEAVGRIVGWHLAIALNLLVNDRGIPPAVRWIEMMRVIADRPVELREWI